MSEPVSSVDPAASTEQTPGLIEYLTTGVAGNVVLALLVLVCFGSTSQFAYLWQDDVNLTSNATLRTFGGLSRIWTELSASPQFMPVTYTSFWAEVRLFGVSPIVSHAINIFLHAANVLLLYHLLKKLLVPGAWAAAAIFAVHPLNVETVAWVSQRGSLLSLTFALAAILFYLRQAAVVPKPVVEGETITSEGVKLGLPEHAGRLYGLFIAMFALAVLSRPTMAVLPVIIAAIAWWKNGRLIKRDLLALIAPVVIAIAVAAVAAHVEHDPAAGGASGVQWQMPIADRIALIGQTSGFYLWKLVAPFPLIFNYAKWSPTGNALMWLPLVGVIAALVALIALSMKLGRGPAAGAIVYAIAILPVTGIVSYYAMRYAWVADHQAYAAIIAPIALIVAAVAVLLRRAPLVAQAAPGIAALVILGFLSSREYRRSLADDEAKAREGELVRLEPTFADERSLWETTLKQNHRSWLAAANFGRWAMYKGISDYAGIMDVGDAQRAAQQKKIAFERARAWLDQAVKINPDCYEAYAYRGELDLQEKNPDAALKDFLLSEEAAARMNAQSFIEPQHSTAQILVLRGDINNAKQAYTQLQDLEPALAKRQPEAFSQMRVEYGDLLMRDVKSPLSGKMPDADQQAAQKVVDQYLTAIDLAPEYIPPKLRLARLLLLTDNTSAALDQLRDALTLDKNNIDAKFLAALTAQKIGDYESAGAQLVNLLQVNPQYLPAHLKLAEILKTVGRQDEAIAELRKTLAMAPNYVPAKRMLEQYTSGAATQPATTQSLGIPELTTP